MGEYEILYKMFGALQTLERSLQISKRTIEINISIPERITKNVFEQERIIREMQKISNIVQAEFTTKESSELNKLVRMFYSLHYMVSPEITSTLEEINGSIISNDLLNNSEQTVTLQ